MIQINGVYDDLQVRKYKFNMYFFLNGITEVHVTIVLKQTAKQYY